LLREKVVSQSRTFVPVIRVELARWIPIVKNIFKDVLASFDALVFAVRRESYFLRRRRTNQVRAGAFFVGNRFRNLLTNFNASPIN